MAARSLRYVAPGEVEVRETPIPDPDDDEVRVRSAVSAISPGTELLVYRGEAPTDLPVDESIDALSGSFEFPLAYGYAAVGRVTAVGENVPDAWLDEQVFAFHPHESHFTVRPDDLVAIPEEFSAETAALLANVESAVNFLMDGRPVVGEHVAVFGQGVVGLLTTALLAGFPLGSLVTVDLHERRRTLSERLGADAALDPEETDVVARLREGVDIGGERLGGDDEQAGERRPVRDKPNGTDLGYELTGDPDALDRAIDAMAYDGRLVVGSWYGSNRATLDLGRRFHRNRGRLVSSQVSSIAPRFRGRWSKARRLGVAWEHLEDLAVDELVTHRVPIDRAQEAYRLLDERPGEAVQVLLTYD